jgi:retinol dehydrogenase-12
VRHAGEEFIDSGKPLHILLNNAGVVNTRRCLSVDGYEETFAVNHLAPFLLTGILLPRLLEQPGARVVNVASEAYKFCRGLDFDDLDSNRRYSTFRVYGKSKLANILFTRELSRRLDSRDIVVNCLHPGAVSTSLGAQNPGLMGKILPFLLRPFFKTPEQGAATSVYLCTASEAGETSGNYYVDSQQVAVRAWARDDEAAARLWDVSEQITDFGYSF